MIYVIAIFGLTIVAAAVSILRAVQLFPIQVYRFRYQPPLNQVDLHHKVEYSDEMAKKYEWSVDELQRSIDREAHGLLLTMLRREGAIKTWDTGHLEYGRHILTRHYHLRILKPDGPL